MGTLSASGCESCPGPMAAHTSPSGTAFAHIIVTCKPSDLKNIKKKGFLLTTRAKKQPSNKETYKRTQTSNF